MDEASRGAVFLMAGEQSCMLASSVLVSMREAPPEASGSRCEREEPLPPFLASPPACSDCEFHRVEF